MFLFIAALILMLFATGSMLAVALIPVAWLVWAIIKDHPTNKTQQ